MPKQVNLIRHEGGRLGWRLNGQSAPPSRVTTVVVRQLFDRIQQSNSVEGRARAKVVQLARFQKLIKILSELRSKKNVQTGDADASPRVEAASGVSPSKGEIDMSSEEIAREAYRKRLDASGQLTRKANHGFPEGYDLKAALLRAYDFFHDKTLEGERKREKLRAKINDHPFHHRDESEQSR